jgi:hypothetical protein
MAAQHHHGKTPAAWTGVIIAFVGFGVASVFMVASKPVGFWVGMGITLLGAVVGGLMKLMGFGAQEPDYVRRTRDKAAEEQPHTPANA